MVVPTTLTTGVLYIIVVHAQTHRPYCRTHHHESLCSLLSKQGDPRHCDVRSRCWNIERMLKCYSCKPRYLHVYFLSGLSTGYWLEVPLHQNRESYLPFHSALRDPAFVPSPLTSSIDVDFISAYRKHTFHEALKCVHPPFCQGNM